MMGGSVYWFLLGEKVVRSLLSLGIESLLLSLGESGEQGEGYVGIGSTVPFFKNLI